MSVWSCHAKISVRPASCLHCIIKGEKVIAIIDHHGYVLAPVPVAPVNETDMVLFPESLKALKKVAKEVGLDLRGAYLNLDGGFDSAHNRQCIFNGSSAWK